VPSLLPDGRGTLRVSCCVPRLAGPEDPDEQFACPRQHEQDAQSNDMEQEHQRRYRERAQKRHEETDRPGIIHRTTNPSARAALPDGLMLLPGRQEGEVLDESLHFAFLALGRKEKSRRWSGGRTRGVGWFWDWGDRNPFLNLKRINKSSRFHHNPHCS
jgi:hypothetical protein